MDSTDCIDGGINAGWRRRARVFVSGGHRQIGNRLVSHGGTTGRLMRTLLCALFRLTLPSG